MAKLSSTLLNNDDVRIEVPAEMLDSGSIVQVVEININRNGKTARFWISVCLSPAGRPVVKLVANEAKGERTTAQNGSFLDLEARRAERA